MIINSESNALGEMKDCSVAVFYAFVYLLAQLITALVIHTCASDSTLEALILTVAVNNAVIFFVGYAVGKDEEKFLGEDVK
jgi:hypothetical protein